jgi:hypothetical protein
MQKHPIVNSFPAANPFCCATCYSLDKIETAISMD